MKRYEMVNIIDVNWEEGDQSRAEEMIREEVSRAGGKVENIGGMGRRQLAYPIDDHLEGIYLLTHFSGPAEGIAPLQNRLKLNPAVIRTLIVRAPTAVEIEIEESVEGKAGSASLSVPEAAPTSAEKTEPPTAPSSGESAPAVSEEKETDVEIKEEDKEADVEIKEEKKE